MSKRMLFVILGSGLVALLAGSHFFFAAQARRSPMWRYAARALERTTPNYDLRKCVDLQDKDRRDFTRTTWKPMPCINTATSNYNPDLRAGNCARFVKNPSRWGFREIPATEAVPGDMIIFFMPNGWARHAAVYIQDSILGPLCATTMYPRGGYMRYFPYRLCLLGTSLIGSFSTIKYYRYQD